MTTATRKLVVNSLVRYKWVSVPSAEVSNYGALQLYCQLNEFQLHSPSNKKLQFQPHQATVASLIFIRWYR